MEPRGEPRVDPVAVKRITPFVRPHMDPDQLPPDYLALLSLTFGVVGLMLKVWHVLRTIYNGSAHPSA